MWLVVYLLPLAIASADNSVCGPIPENFINMTGGRSYEVIHKSRPDIQLSGYLMPYHVFDIKGFIAGAMWKKPGSVELKSSMTDEGLTVHIANSDWTSMTDVTGTVFSKHTSDTSDLDKIDSYICGDFNAQQALVTTFDCLREGDDATFPKARYQITLAFGYDSNGQNRSFVLIVTDVLPGDAWDYLSSAPYRYYLYYNSEYYPITVTANSILAIEVTSKQSFTADEEPNIITPPCTSSVTCTLTRGGALDRFSGFTTLLPDDKLVLAEWNPPSGDCKFKVVVNFQHTYRWSSVAIGPHPRYNKYFRFVDFGRVGKVSQRGWKCGSWCRGVITTFPHNITNVSLDVTYATVSELEPNTKYVIDTELCSDASEPNYKCTHHFTDSYSQPVVTLEIDKDFYMANKDQMSGLCVGDDE